MFFGLPTAYGLNSNWAFNMGLEADSTYKLSARAAESPGFISAWAIACRSFLTSDIKLVEFMSVSMDITCGGIYILGRCLLKLAFQTMIFECVFILTYRFCNVFTLLFILAAVTLVALRL